MSGSHFPQSSFNTISLPLLRYNFTFSNSAFHSCTGPSHDSFSNAVEHENMPTKQRWISTLISISIVKYYTALMSKYTNPHAEVTDVTVTLHVERVESDICFGSGVRDWAGRSWMLSFDCCHVTSRWKGSVGVPGIWKNPDGRWKTAAAAVITNH